MPERRKIEALRERKVQLRMESDVLRRRASVLWHEADRPLRAVDDALSHLRRVHPLAIGAAGIGIFLLRRRLLANRRLLGAIASTGWFALRNMQRLKRNDGQRLNLEEPGDRGGSIQR